MLSLIPYIKQLFHFYKPKTAIALAIPLIYLSLSTLWSGNPLRAILTAGLLWLLCFSALGLIYFIKNSPSLQKALIKSLLISAAVFSVFCWLQCILDLIGVSRDITLLCPGCVNSIIGFPHPNGFAIEPQFMGNLLIAPTLLCFYLIKLKKKHMMWLAGFLAATLFITFSRGAIYAFLIGFILLQVLIKNKKFYASCLLVAGAFIVSLLAQGAFAAVSPTSDTFFSGMAKSVHQLSLGKIDFRPQEKPGSEATQDEQSSQFSGYIAESTDVRLSLNSLALQTWFSSPSRAIFGVGLGSAGVAMNNQFPDQIGPKEIVQNEYLSLLLESGLVGCTIILLAVFYLARRSAAILKCSPLFLATCASFLLTLLFFSGLPNALHISLFPLLFLHLSKDDFFIEHKV